MSRKPVCFVFGASQTPNQPPVIGAKDLVIAADGGYAYTKSTGIRADVLIGDFDSLDAPPRAGIDVPIVWRLPEEKDQTDMLAALQYGLKQGFDCFHLYGGTGGRIDHTLANIQCLVFLLNHGARGYLHDQESVITALRGEVWLEAQQHGTISLFSLGECAEGVCLRGLKYELENARLAYDYPRGVSNAFTGNPAYIKVESGTLGMIYPSEARELEPSPFHANVYSSCNNYVPC
jgi:thiamine pyrophosphokinase